MLEYRPTYVERPMANVKERAEVAGGLWGTAGSMLLTDLQRRLKAQAVEEAAVSSDARREQASIAREERGVLSGIAAEERQTERSIAKEERGVEAKAAERSLLEGRLEDPTSPEAIQMKQKADKNEAAINRSKAATRKDDRYVQPTAAKGKVSSLYSLNGQPVTNADMDIQYKAYKARVPTNKVKQLEVLDDRFEEAVTAAGGQIDDTTYLWFTKPEGIEATNVQAKAEIERLTAEHKAAVAKLMSNKSFDEFLAEKGILTSGAQAPVAAPQQLPRGSNPLGLTF